MAKSISDVSWYELTRQLEYKAKWNGRKYVKIDRFYASSHLCSVKKNKKKKKSRRKGVVFFFLNYHEERDIQKKNILLKEKKGLEEGLRQIA